MSIKLDSFDYYNNSEFVSNSFYDYRDNMDQRSVPTVDELLNMYDEIPATAGEGESRSAWLYEIIDASKEKAHFSINNIFKKASKN